MQHLPLPVAAADDEAVVNKLAKAALWAPHETDWIAAYQAYRLNGGNPFAIKPHDFGDGVGNLQYALYDGRSRSGELGRMRRKAGLKSCPVCGSPVTGDLDHYLPRDVYPEFSIMRANLVPACRHCNSGVKGTTVHGTDPRRFIHPYFDSWASQALWYVELLAPLKAATFRPRPMPTLPVPQGEIVEFHLKNVLGVQFHLSMANYWSSLPGQLKLRDPDLTTASTTAQVDLELRVAEHAGGINCWQAALLRGVRRDAIIIEHLRQEATIAMLPLAP